MSILRPVDKSPTRVPKTPVFLGREPFWNTFELVLTCRKIPRSEVKSFWRLVALLVVDQKTPSPCKY